MIRATELRIGNWVNDISGNPTQVRGVGTNGIWISKSGPATETAFKPIPLTEEWLVKFGFEYRSGWEDSWHKSPIGLYFNPYKSGVCLEQIWDKLIESDLVNIQYVHQLQNLYFALTGNELAIDQTKPTI